MGVYQHVPPDYGSFHWENYDYITLGLVGNFQADPFVANDQAILSPKFVHWILILLFGWPLPLNSGLFEDFGAAAAGLRTY